LFPDLEYEARLDRWSADMLFPDMESVVGTSFCWLFVSHMSLAVYYLFCRYLRRRRVLLSVGVWGCAFNVMAFVISVLVGIGSSVILGRMYSRLHGGQNVWKTFVMFGTSCVGADRAGSGVLRMLCGLAFWNVPFLFVCNFMASCMAFGEMYYRVFGLPRLCLARIAAGISAFGFSEAVGNSFGGIHAFYLPFEQRNIANLESSLARIDTEISSCKSMISYLEHRLNDPAGGIGWNTRRELGRERDNHKVQLDILKNLRSTQETQLACSRVFLKGIMDTMAGIGDDVAVKLDPEPTSGLTKVLTLLTAAAILYTGFYFLWGMLVPIGMPT